jgi:hypothetical protein
MILLDRGFMKVNTEHSPILEQTETITPPSPAETQRGAQLMNGSLAFAATRCTIQYILLPFVLPFLGLAGGWSTVISMGIDLVALGMIVYNVQRLWHSAWRWRYLGLGLVMTAFLGLFFWLNIQKLLA